MSFDLTAALHSEVPLTVAGLASTMIEALRLGGGARDRQTGRRITTVPQLADSFMGSPAPEATALLHAIAVLTTDEPLARFICHELADRHDPLPEDITRLGELTASAAYVRQYADGIGEGLVLELTGPGVTRACIAAFVDYRFGSAVKFAAVVAASFEEFIALDARAPEPVNDGTSFVPIDRADAAARLRGAITQYDALTDVIQPAEQWPWHRPLIELVLRSLPAGGQGYPEHDPAFDPGAEEPLGAALVSAFLGSEFGASVPVDAASVEVVDALALLSCMRAERGVIRWTAPTVQWLLTDALPLYLPADAPRYADAPHLLRALIAYCHDLLGVAETATTMACAAVARFEGDYLRLRDDLAVAARRRDLEQVVEEATGSRRATRDGPR
ncbi:MAG: hypothetical protein V9G19_21855 [Tetrasphaera sp.]